jgi:hypothetical protein
MITEIGIRENSVLDVTVSAFADVKATMQPVDINLITWLTSLKHKPTVDAIRAEPDENKQKQMKKRLPLITPSGTFEPGRKDTGLIAHSGLICIDIDKQDNLDLENFDELGPMLKGIPHAAYVGRSVRGEGYMVIFVLEDSTLHRVYYRAIEEQFAEFNVVIDSCCINEARARFYSYCEDGQMQHQAIPFSRLPTPKLAPKPKIKRTHSGSYSGNGKRIPEAVIDEIAHRVSVAEVVSYCSGSTTTTTGAGGSLKMQCPCPDTRDGSDRFTVWPQDSTFFCHKCHRGKNIAGPYKLLEEFQDLGFREAAQFLAETFAPDLLSHFDGGNKTPAPRQATHARSPATLLEPLTQPAAPALTAQADEDKTNDERPADSIIIDGTAPPATRPAGWTVDAQGTLIDATGLPYKQWYFPDDIDQLTAPELGFIYRHERVQKIAADFTPVAVDYYGGTREAINEVLTDNGERAAVHRAGDEQQQLQLFTAALIRAMLDEPELETELARLLRHREAILRRSVEPLPTRTPLRSLFAPRAAARATA